MFLSRIFFFNSSRPWFRCKESFKTGGWREREEEKKGEIEIDRLRFGGGGELD